jgi:hypothetical protein
LKCLEDQLEITFFTQFDVLGHPCIHVEVRDRHELAGGDPDQFEGGISGSAVQEGSGASITWDPNESNE